MTEGNSASSLDGLIDLLGKAIRGRDFHLADQLAASAQTSLSGRHWIGADPATATAPKHHIQWLRRISWCAQKARQLADLPPDPASWWARAHSRIEWDEFDAMSALGQCSRAWALDMVLWLLNKEEPAPETRTVTVPVAVVRGGDKSEILYLQCQPSFLAAGQCFPHPTQLLQNYPSPAFLEAFDDAATAARSLIPTSELLPAVRWSLSKADGKPVGPVYGPSASAAFALCLVLLWRGQIPDQGLLVMADCRRDGSLKGVDGLKKKAEAALALEGKRRIDTMVVADAQARREIEAIGDDRVAVTTASSLCELVETRAALVTELNRYLSQTIAASEKGSTFLQGRKLTGVWVDASLVEARASEVEKSPATEAALHPPHANSSRAESQATWPHLVEQSAAQPKAHLAVIGPAGSGKSFLILWTAIRLATSSLQALRDRRLPLSALGLPFCVPWPLITATESGNVADSVLKVVGDRFHLSATLMAWMRQRLEDGNAWFLLDAADEAADSERLREFIQQLPHYSAKSVLTCRESDWPTIGQGLPGDFQAWRLAALKASARDDLLRRWFGHNTAAIARVFRVMWIHPHLRQLAETPLLLTFLCALSGSDFDLGSQTTIAEIYERIALDMLDRPKPLRSKMSSERREHLLRRLREASPVWLEGRVRQNRVRLAELAAGGITPKDVAFLRSTGFLVQVSLAGPRVYAFCHHTFLDFLVAWQKAEQANSEGWSAIASWVERKSWHPEYREVFMFLAACLRDPAALLDSLPPGHNNGSPQPVEDDVFHSRLKLAAISAGAIKTPPSPKTTQSIVDLFERLLEVRAAEIERCGRESDSLSRALAVVVRKCRARAVRHWVLDSTQKLDEVISHAIRFQFRERAVVEAILRRMEAGDSVRPTLLRDFASWLRSDPEFISTAIELTAHWQGRALCQAFDLLGNMDSAHPLLCQRLGEALAVGSAPVKESAARAIVTIALHTHNSVQSLLGHLDDGNPLLWLQALDSPRLSSFSDPAVLEIASRCLMDPSGEVRFRAIVILSRLAHRSSELQAAIVRALVRHYIDPPLLPPKPPPERNIDELLNLLAEQIDTPDSQGCFGEFEALLAPNCDWSRHYHLLLGHLHSNDLRLRRLAFELQCRLAPSDDAIVQVAINALADPHEEIQNYGWDLLRHVQTASSQSGCLLLECMAARHYLDPDVALAKLRFHGTEIEARLLSLLSNENHQTKMAALSFAPCLVAASQKVKEALEICAEDAHPQVRRLAMRAIAQTTAPGLALHPTIAGRLRDEDWEVRLEAALALRSRPVDPATLNALAALVESDDATSRRVAIHVLGTLRVQATLLKRLFAPRLTDLCLNVASAAAVELGRLGEVDAQWVRTLSRCFRYRGRGLRARGTAGPLYVSPQHVRRCGPYNLDEDLLQIVCRLKLRNPEVVNAILQLIVGTCRRGEDENDELVQEALASLRIRVLSVEPLAYKTFEELSGEP